MIKLTAKITLADGSHIYLDKNNSVSQEGLITDRSNLELPSWGVISNSGSLSFVDYDGRVKNFAQNLKLAKQATVNLYLQDTLSGRTMQIGEYFSTSWDYDNNNFQARLQATDGLQKLQDISITPLLYDLREEDYSVTATEMYDYICDQVIANGFSILKSTDEAFDTTTLEHLNKIVIPFPYIQYSSLWRVLDDFAVAFQLHIFKNRKGVIVCVYNGGD